MFDIKNVIQKGERAKYQVIVNYDDFSMRNDDFTIRLYWGMKGDEIVIPKSDLLQDEDGKFFIQFDTKDMIGIVKAEVTAYVPDSDYPDDVRTEMERVPVCFVNGADKLPIRMGSDYLYDGQHVTFIRTSLSGLRSLYFYLRDIVGLFLFDSTGRQLRARKRERNT